MQPISRQPLLLAPYIGERRLLGLLTPRPVFPRRPSLTRGSCHQRQGNRYQRATPPFVLSPFFTTDLTYPGFNRISQHHYSGTFCFGNGAELQDLMTKANIRSNLTPFSPDIAATRAQGLPYVLGETNSLSCHVRNDRY